MYVRSGRDASVDAVAGASRVQNLDGSVYSTPSCVCYIIILLKHIGLKKIVNKAFSQSLYFNYNKNC